MKRLPQMVVFRNDYPPAGHIVTFDPVRFGQTVRCTHEGPPCTVEEREGRLVITPNVWEPEREFFDDALEAVL